MPAQMIVGPAMAAADRRAPERSPENATDHAARNGPHGTRNNKTGSRAGPGADPVGTCFQTRHRGGGRKHRSGQHQLFHLFVPRLKPPAAPTNIAAADSVAAEIPINSWQRSGVFWTPGLLAMRVARRLRGNDPFFRRSFLISANPGSRAK